MRSAAPETRPRLAQKVRRDEVAAASRREELDELGVGRRDQDDRERGRDREEDREMRVVPEREERLFRPYAEDERPSAPRPTMRGRPRAKAGGIPADRGDPGSCRGRSSSSVPDRHDSIEYTRAFRRAADGTIEAGCRAPGKIRRSPLRRLLRRPQAPPCRERGRRRVRIRARDPRAGRHAAAPARRQGRGRPGPDGHGQDRRVPDRDLRAPRAHEASRPSPIAGARRRPTRELAIQIQEDAKALGHFLKPKIVTVFGGIDYVKQRDQLRAGCDLLVGTPGASSTTSSRARRPSERSSPS